MTRIRNKERETLQWKRYQKYLRLHVFALDLAKYFLIDGKYSLISDFFFLKKTMITSVQNKKKTKHI